MRSNGRRPRLFSTLRATILALALVVPALAAAQTGSISGTVTNAQTGAPIANVPVAVFNTAKGEPEAILTTNASGVYTASGLPPGTYAVAAVPSEDDLDYVDEFFDDIQSPFGITLSEVIDATVLTLTSGAALTNIDFALDQRGQVSGTVTDAAGQAVQNATVFAVARNGTAEGRVFAGNARVVGSATTNAAGAYTITGLVPGSVYLYTTNTAGLVNEIFDNITCVGPCNSSTAVASGTAVPVTAGGTTAGRDFSLNRGGSITGTITNAATGAPVQGVNVQVATRVSGAISLLGNNISNASGVYTIGGLATGNYFLFTTGGGGGMMTELYDNIPCPLNCNPIVPSGVEIPVTAGTPTPGKDFALETGGAISGTVTNQATSNPVQGVQVTVVTRVGTTNFQRSVTTDASGNYTLAGLPTGRYWAYISFAPSGLVPEILDDIPCVGACNINVAIATGAPIDVTQGTTTSGRNFALSPGGGIRGTVRNAATGSPVTDDLQVDVYARSGSSFIFVTSDGVDSSGVYQVSGLAAGEYVIASSGLGFRSEAFDNVPCLGVCGPAALGSATPITVALGTVATGKDFSLDRAELLFGKVTSSVTGQPLTGGVSVTLYERGSSTLMGTSSVDYRGGFLFPNVPNGTYVAFTSNSIGYRNEIFDDIPCATTCSPAAALASGTPITITSAAADSPAFVGGINFALDVRTAAPGAPTNFRASVSGSTAQFTWTPPTPSTTGLPASYIIDAGGAPGTTIVSLPAGSGTSFTVPSVPPGTFYVRVRAVNASGSSGPSNEVRLVIAGGVSAPLAPASPIAFMQGGRLSLTWQAPAAGQPPTGYLVEAGSSSGLANIATLPVTGRAFSYNGVPPGFYFLRVRATNAGGVSPPSPEVMIVVGGVPSPTGPPSFTSHSVSGKTVTLNWAAPAFGTATSYFIEAGSATGLANLATVNTGNANTTASFTGVPAGTYYVRVRGVNAQGMSIVSNERTVIVQ
jgi:5-hydroxyisourate hydrolase-like protein (transthyretin family)